MIQDPLSSSLPPSATAAPFRIVTIYDSAESSLDAAKASAIVARELGEDVRLERASWRVQLLEDASARENAAAAATKADMVVIALSLPAPKGALRCWLSLWEKSRQTDTGLLAWIPSSPEAQSNAVEDLLYETAITAQMDFLCSRTRRF